MADSAGTIFLLLPGPRHLLHRTRPVFWLIKAAIKHKSWNACGSDIPMNVPLFSNLSSEAYHCSYVAGKETGSACKQAWHVSRGCSRHAQHQAPDKMPLHGSNTPCPGFNPILSSIAAHSDTSRGIKPSTWTSTVHSATFHHLRVYPLSAWQRHCFTQSRA